MAGIVSAFLAAGSYGLCLIDIDPMQLGDLGVANQSDLKFLKSAKIWRLSKLTINGSRDGSVTTSELGVGFLTTKENESLVALEGIPALKGLNPEVEVSSNALLLNGTVFIGKPFKTERLMWQDLSAEGVEFKGDGGAVIIAHATNGNAIYLIVQLEVYGKTVEASYVGTPQ